MARKPIQTPGDQPADAPEVAVEQQAPAQAEAPEAAGLPDISTIDPTKITRSVLTQQGWVCPA